MFRSLFIAILLATVVLGATAAPAFPAKVTHKYGTTTIDKAPQRVVTIGLVDQDAFIALGTVPVATREWYGNVPGALFPWAKAVVGSAPLPQVLTYELDFEKIAALSPDVIVAIYSGLTQEEYKTLSKIAPTVAQPGQFVDWGAPWQYAVRTTGTILGKSAEAEALITGVEKKFADARKAHPQFAGKKAAVLSQWGWPNTYYAYGSQDGRGRFLTELGFTTIAEVDTLAKKDFGASISHERLNLMDIDAVVWLTDGPEGEKTIRNDAVWSKLKVSKEGRDLYLDTKSAYYDALNFATVLSLPYALQGLAPVFDKLVDGNPATR